MSSKILLFFAISYQTGGWAGGGKAEDAKTFIGSDHNWQLRLSSLERKVERQDWEGLNVLTGDGGDIGQKMLNMPFNMPFMDLVMEDIQRVGCQRER